MFASAARQPSRNDTHNAQSVNADERMKQWEEKGIETFTFPKITNKGSSLLYSTLVFSSSF
jgi:hypothetical protein